MLHYAHMANCSMETFHLPRYRRSTTLIPNPWLVSGQPMSMQLDILQELHGLAAGLHAAAMSSPHTAPPGDEAS